MIKCTKNCFCKHFRYENDKKDTSYFYSHILHFYSKFLHEITLKK